MINTTDHEIAAQLEKMTSLFRQDGCTSHISMMLPA